jgi:DNA primase
VILIEILETGGADFKSTQKEDELVVCCPFCQERGFPPDTAYHLGLNVKEALAHCFRCGWKGRGVMFVGRKLCKALNVAFNLKQLKETRRAKEEAPPKKQEEKVASVLFTDASDIVAEYERFTHSDDEVELAARAYLKMRGVSMLQIIRHKIGYAATGDFAWRVLFPVLDAQGGVHGCVGRALNKTMKPKYLNSRGVKILWNAGIASGTAVVVEGVMDALRVETALLRMRGMTAVARLGAAITSPQLDQLKEFSEVVILPDWDRAGVQGATELGSRCHARGIQTRVAVPKAMSGLDPGEMDEPQIVDEVGAAIPWSKDAEWRLRLAMTKV